MELWTILASICFGYTLFEKTCKRIFDAIVFVFLIQPYNVGDCVEIEGVQMKVEEMNILRTVFLRSDNQLKIIYPNSVISTKPITIISCSPNPDSSSPDMGDAIDFCIHVSTPVEKIPLMKERITRYIESNCEYTSPMIVCNKELSNWVSHTIWVSHTKNHEYMGERWKTRRSHLVEGIVKVFKDLDIDYRMDDVCNVENLATAPSSSTSTSTSNKVMSYWTNKMYQLSSRTSSVSS